MDALLFDPRQPGHVAFVADHPEPQRRRGEVLVRVHLAGICATDLELVRGYMGFAGVPGHEFVGTVVAGSRDLKGKRVVAEINCVCRTCDMCRRGLTSHCRRRTVLGISGRDGAFAQFISVPARNCHVVPRALDDARAVFVEPLAAAVHVATQQRIDRTMRVAVLGVGRLGLLVAQVLALRKCRLTAIDRAPAAVAMCERLGVAGQALADVKPAADFDVVVECTGRPDGLRLALELVRPRGTIVLKSTYALPGDRNLAPLVVNEVRVVGNRCGPFPPALRLLCAGKIQVEDMIAGTYALRRGPEAFAAAAEPGNIKILLQPDRP
ncbi:MAG: alcohol dehydrogenase catalytic domain-containing protein [Planctomycetes bacterium]|nr:alcohol dehydrogenase catalytic domain-containing protein [Planctomycetota bacterium]